MSDASFNDGRAAHAWILSSGDVDDIENQIMNISGHGSVNGYSPYLSSSRGELTGITIVTVKE